MSTEFKVGDWVRYHDDMWTLGMVSFIDKESYLENDDLITVVGVEGRTGVDGKWYPVQFTKLIPSVNLVVLRQGDENEF